MEKKNSKNKFLPVYQKIFLALLVTITVSVLVLNYQRRDDKSKPVMDNLSPTPQRELKIVSPASDNQKRQLYVDMALADLAQKLKLAPDLMTVVNIQETNFSDTSLGCPVKNRMYAQVITPGFIIELLAQSHSYIYHAGLNTVVSCESDQM